MCINQNLDHIRKIKMMNEGLKSGLWGTKPKTSQLKCTPSNVAKSEEKEDCESSAITDISWQSFGMRLGFFDI
jgi:hypothetical protein